MAPDNKPDGRQLLVEVLKTSITNWMRFRMAMRKEVTPAEWEAFAKETGLPVELLKEVQSSTFLRLDGAIQHLLDLFSNTGYFMDEEARKDPRIRFDVWEVLFEGRFLHWEALPMSLRRHIVSELPRGTTQEEAVLELIRILRKTYPMLPKDPSAYLANVLPKGVDPLTKVIHIP